MVKNRSQMQLHEGSSLSDAQKEELAFFANHDALREVPRDILGVDALTRRLTSLLVKRIKAVLPQLKWELQEQLSAAETELARLGKDPPETPFEKTQMMLQLFANYARILRATVRGEYRDKVLAGRPELRLRTACDRIFRRLQTSVGMMRPDFEAADFAEKLHHELRALRGRELPGLLNSYFFYGFMARHIELWRPSVESARHECYGTCLAVCSGLIDQLCPAFPRMASAVHDTIAGWLEENGDSVMNRINEVFKQESDPFVSHDELAQARPFLLSDPPRRSGHLRAHPRVTARSLCAAVELSFRGALPVMRPRRRAPIPARRRY